MLAYVFWHRPRRDVEAGAYEEAQREFHAALATPSACFRLAKLPFEQDPGYEDWYLVESWRELGDLNADAVDPGRRPHHDRVASMSAEGWGGVYSLVRGTATIPSGTEWHDKPAGKRSEEFITSMGHDAVWRRQLVLSPAPEFCGATRSSTGRERL